MYLLLAAVMKLDSRPFDGILAEAVASLRKRMHYDLRMSPADTSQRMLNVLMPETVIPIHRHNKTNEVVVICRGAVREEFYDAAGVKTDSFVLEAGGDCPALLVPKGVYHTCVCLVPGSVIFEAKDGTYDPKTTEDFLSMGSDE